MNRKRSKTRKSKRKQNKRRGRSWRTRTKKRLYKQRGGLKRMEGETDKEYINRFQEEMREENKNEKRNMFDRKIGIGEKIKLHLLSRAYRNKKKECLINSMHEFDDINDVKKNSDNYKRCKDQAKQEYY